MRTGTIEHAFESGWSTVIEAAPRPGAPAWSTWAPGPELAAALSGCEAVDLAVDEGHDAAERLAGWEALVSWATGQLYRETGDYLLARVARARGAGRGELASEAVAMEVATLARVAPRTGEIRIHQAATLVEQLPGTLAALEDGRISLAHARVVLEQTELCDPGTARAVDAELWSRPPRDRTPAQLRDLVRRIVTRLDPLLLRRRGEQARADRELRYWSDDHGATGVIQLRLPADEARGVYAVIDAVARGAGDPADGPKRTLGQKRADSTRDLILDGATTGRDQGCCCDHTAQAANADTDAGGDDAATVDEPVEAATDAVGEDSAGADAVGEDSAGTDAVGEDSAGTDAVGEDSAADAAGDATSGAATTGDVVPLPVRDAQRGLRAGVRSPVRTEVRVTIGWDVLAGFSDRPGELEGHGPIPAAMARRLAADPDATWRRLLTDPTTGTAAHLDARRYRPPGSMQEFVRVRDVTCAAPGCRVPAARCDLDHVVPYDHATPGGGAGATRADKLKPACRRHHRLKTLTDWSAELAPDPEGGPTPVIVWTSPSGHRFWVRSPALDPPPWDRDPDDLAPPEQREGTREHVDPPDWPRDVDSWRRREAVPRPFDPRQRAV